MSLPLFTPSTAEGLSEHSLPQPSYQEASEDAKPPRTGPAFLCLNSIAYRLEMLLITIILLVVLLYWRLFVVKDLNLLTTVFWIILPDLASFIPIGLAMRGAKEWPRWGPGLYNFFHTLLVWIPVFAVWSILSGGVQWPLVGWAGHITADRSVGYYLRAASARASARVGQKGELFPSEEVREEAGLKPGDQVLYKADHGRIEVVKIPGLREAFSRRKTAKITFEEFERMTGEVLDK